MEESIIIFIGTAWDYVVTFVSCFQCRVLYLFYCADYQMVASRNMFQRHNSALLHQCLSAVDSTDIQTNPIICLARYHLTTHVGPLTLDYFWAKTLIKRRKCHKNQSRTK